MMEKLPEEIIELICGYLYPIDLARFRLISKYYNNLIPAFEIDPLEEAIVAGDERILRKYELPRDICVRLAKHFHFDIIGNFRDKNHRWYQKIFKYALIHGDLNVLKYLTRNNCPKPTILPSKIKSVEVAEWARGFIGSTVVMSNVVKNNSLEMIQWFIVYGYYEETPENICEAAILRGDPDILNIVHKHIPNLPDNCLSMAKSEEIMLLLLEYGCHTSEVDMRNAIRLNCRNVISILIDKGHYFDDESCLLAAYHGHTDLVMEIINTDNAGKALSGAMSGNYISMAQWIIDNYIQYISDPLDLAIHSNNAQMVHLILQEHVTVTSRHLEDAIYRKNDDIIKLLISYGDQTAMPSFNMIDMIKYGNVDIVTMMLYRGAKLPYTPLECAIRSGNVEMFDFMYDRLNNPKLYATHTESTIYKNNIDMLKSILDKGKRPNPKAFSLAAQLGRVDMIHLMADYL